MDPSPQVKQVFPLRRFHPTSASVFLSSLDSFFQLLPPMLSPAEPSHAHMLFLQCRFYSPIRLVAMAGAAFLIRRQIHICLAGHFCSLAVKSASFIASGTVIPGKVFIYPTAFGTRASVLAFVNGMLGTDSGNSARYCGLIGRVMVHLTQVVQQNCRAKNR